MADNVFDRVAKEYEKIHNQSLPPGVPSASFILQRAEFVTDWILSELGDREFCCLDFGCGNGRLLKSISDSERLAGLVASGRLRLFGFDTSIDSLREARSLVGNQSITFLDDWAQVPAGIHFDLVLSCHVFHHIPMLQRPAAATTLHRRMRRGGRLVLWEQNPLNPVTSLLIDLCPFDSDARLLTAADARRLFTANGFTYLKDTSINLLPPGWKKFPFLSKVENLVLSFPIGAQYWIMFERA